MNGALLGLVAAGLSSALCVLVALRARSEVGAHAPPSAALLIERATESAEGGSRESARVLAEIDSARRGALGAGQVLLVRFQALSRIALAAGAGSAMLALAAELGQSLQRAALMALLCFVLGGTAAAMVGWLGQAAREDCRRFRDRWNQRQREAAHVLGLTGEASGWTDHGGAR